MRKQFSEPPIYLGSGKIILACVLILYVIILIIPLLEPRQPIFILLPAAALLPFLLAGAYLYVRGSGQFTLTDDAIVWQRFRKETRLPYAEITHVNDAGGPGLPALVLTGAEKKITISRLVGGFPTLYETLRQKVPAMNTDAAEAVFPFELKVQPYQILDTVGGVLLAAGILAAAPVIIILVNAGQNRWLVYALTLMITLLIALLGAALVAFVTIKVSAGLKNITFLPDEIHRRDLLGAGTTYDVQDVECISREARPHPNSRVNRTVYPLVVRFKNGSEFTIGEDAARIYAISLERIAARLRRLYPHIDQPSPTD
jgi:hypothetical protein